MQLSKLKINPNNPQIFDDLSKLEKSIKEFPKMMELRPIVVDSNYMVLGGNKRLICLQNLDFKEIPDNWVVLADKLTEEEKQRFIIADNVDFGVWDFELLNENWNIGTLEDWGVDFGGVDVNDEDLKDSFSLASGDKAPFQQQTYTLADEQAEQIKNAITDVKQTEEYKYIETFGNENSNGNALYLIIMQWVEQKK